MDRHVSSISDDDEEGDEAAKLFYGVDERNRKNDGEQYSQLAQYKASLDKSELSSDNDSNYQLETIDETTESAISGSDSFQDTDSSDKLSSTDSADNEKASGSAKKHLTRHKPNNKTSNLTLSCHGSKPNSAHIEKLAHTLGDSKQPSGSRKSAYIENLMAKSFASRLSGLMVVCD